MKTPAGPPPLSAMAARQAALEERRAEQFERWREALAASGGFIKRAALRAGIASSTAARLVNSLGLREFARELRQASGYSNFAGGRPGGTTKKKGHRRPAR